jgi:hypothetical protein
MLMDMIFQGQLVGLCHAQQSATIASSDIFLRGFLRPEPNFRADSWLCSTDLAEPAV